MPPNYSFPVQLIVIGEYHSSVSIVEFRVKNIAEQYMDGIKAMALFQED